LVEDECQAIFKWLEVTDPSSIHNKSCDLHEPYTGDWIFRSEDFGKWLEGSDRFFWLHGIPGAGKTVLASYIIEEVKKEIENYDLGIFLAYYYCYFGNGQDETAPCLRWIISQLCRQSNHIPEEVRKLYKQGTEPRVSELLDALAAVLTRIVYAYIVIDALDESLNRRTLLDTLVNLASKEAFQNLQILCLSRKEEDINLIISDIGHNMSLSNELVDEDIHAYIQHQLTTDHDFTRWPENLLNQIETSLVRGAQGM
jgi:Cdc6-like AAA superfamily ATPase